MWEQAYKSNQEYAKRTDEEKKLRYGMFELLRDAEMADTSLEIKKNLEDRLRLDDDLDVDSKKSD